MLTNPTIDGLYELKLDVMATHLIEQRTNPSFEGLGFEERLGFLVDQEVAERRNRRLQRLLRLAKLRSNAVIEDIDFRAQRSLNKATVLSLAESHWVDQHQNLLVVGATGVGKTYLACALANSAIRRGHNALYVRAPRLFEDLANARVDGRFPRLMASFARTEVLIIDDLFLRPLEVHQAADLLEVIEDRYQLRSTIITAQLPISDWHAAIGDATIADAVLDRLLHNAHRIELSGDSLRTSEAKGKPLATTQPSKTSS
jgi:DNA replication protein DnaC